MLIWNNTTINNCRYSFYSTEYLKMSDVRYLSKKFITEFIELYKTLPSLWNLKSKHYYDRAKKNSDYEIMVKKLKEVEPEATREMVTQKINSMRGSRRKEMAKIKRSIEEGGKIYVPKLWYYEQMEFVDGQEAPSPTHVVLRERENKREHASYPESQIDTESGSVSVVSSDRRPSVPSTNSIPKQASSEPDDVLAPVIAFTTQVPPKAKRKRKIQREETNPKNHEAFGRYVAHKLENLQNEQRIYVEKIINDAIFEAELGNLNRDCYVCVPVRSDSE